MTTGEKIYECRKKAGMTQEELADRLGVSRQSVSKWEADAAFPETEKILALCKLFGVSADELLFGTEHVESEVGGAPAQASEGQKSDEDDGKGVTWGVIRHEGAYRFEYISKRRALGLPLVHIHFGFGMCRAHGIIALGNFASGFLSAGFFSAGFLSLGIFAVGLLVLGNFVLGCLAFGSVAAGILAFGGITIGVFAFGAIAVGNVAVGGLTVGRIALGDTAYGWLSVGLSSANGTHAFLIPDALTELKEFAETNFGEGLARFIYRIARMLE